MPPPKKPRTPLTDALDPNDPTLDPAMRQTMRGEAKRVVKTKSLFAPLTDAVARAVAPRKTTLKQKAPIVPAAKPLPKTTSKKKG